MKLPRQDSGDFKDWRMSVLGRQETLKRSSQAKLLDRLLPANSGRPACYCTDQKIRRTIGIIETKTTTFKDVYLPLIRQKSRFPQCPGVCLKLLSNDACNKCETGSGKWIIIKN